MSFPLESVIFPTDYIETFVTPFTINGIIEERKYSSPVQFLPLQQLRKQYNNIENTFEKPERSSNRDGRKFEAREKDSDFNPLWEFSDEDSKVKAIFPDSLERISSNLIAQLQVFRSFLMFIDFKGFLFINLSITRPKFT